MKNHVHRWCTLIGLAFLPSLGIGQSLAVGIPLLEEGLRRRQLNGESDKDISFTIRPLHVTNELNFDSAFYFKDPASQKRLQDFATFAKGKGKVRFLSAIIRQQ